MLKLLEEAALAACLAVHELGMADESKRGMGTTLSLLLAVEARAFVAHVGDSRMYLVRGERIHQLTEDHTLQNELLKRGKLRPAISKGPKNALTRAIAVRKWEVDTLQLACCRRRVLICSDGLYLQQEGELKLHFEAPPDEAAPRLCARQPARGTTTARCSDHDLGLAPLRSPRASSPTLDTLQTRRGSST